MEDWKPVPGYEEMYSASSSGRVRSERRFSAAANRWIPERVLSTPANSAGYPVATLYKDGRRWMTTAHQLVMLAFQGLPPKDMEVNHINGNKADARLVNLEYVTASQNQQHAVRTGLRKGLRGESNQTSKLQDSDVLRIHEMYAGGDNQYDIAGALGVSQERVWSVLKRRAWTHVSVPLGLRNAVASRLEHHGSRGKLGLGGARAIRRRYHEGGVTQQELASQFGVTQGTVSAVLLGKAWPGP